MPRSYAVADTRAVGGAGYPQLAIWEPATPLSRFRLFEFAVSSSASPADNVGRYSINRFATAPTGGTSLTANIAPLDVGEPASAALSMGAATGAAVQGVFLMYFAVNQRATFRWVAAPTKEIVCPNTTLNGLALYSAYQSGAFNIDSTFMWDE